jgi:hypothetical protein
MTRKTVAIVQSNYIPWKGYFDLIAAADELILYDDMQYTRRDWRNRNRVKTPSGPVWLTIPVEVKGKYLQRIRETRVSDARWPEVHWKTIVHNYARARYFREYHDFLEELFLGCQEELLSLVNHRFLTAVCGVLGLRTRIAWSTDYELVEGRTERLVDLCRKAGGTEYLSGPAARAYLDEAQFRAAGIALRWMDYSGYPEYPQLHPPFDHAVSIVDLLLNAGPEARKYMKAA